MRLTEGQIRRITRMILLEADRQGVVDLNPLARIIDRMVRVVIEKLQPSITEINPPKRSRFREAARIEAILRAEIKSDNQLRALAILCKSLSDKITRQIAQAEVGMEAIENMVVKSLVYGLGFLLSHGYRSSFWTIDEEGPNIIANIIRASLGGANEQVEDIIPSIPARDMSKEQRAQLLEDLKSAAEELYGSFRIDLGGADPFKEKKEDIIRRWERILS